MCCTGRAKKASWPDALLYNCGCGVWLCGRSESNCHVAFPFRSQLPGEELLFVCLPQTVTAWQLRFHQSREWGKNRVFGENVQLCALLQHACECVKYENLMKPTGGAWLQRVLPFLLRGAASSCSSKFRKKQKKTEKESWPFCPDAIRTDHQGIKWITGWQGRLGRGGESDCNEVNGARVMPHHPAPTSPHPLSPTAPPFPSHPAAKAPGH